MRILDIREKTVSIASPIANAYIDFSKMTCKRWSVLRNSLPQYCNLPGITQHLVWAATLQTGLQSHLHGFVALSMYPRSL